ncbi:MULTISPECIES: DUF1127 domain-containing protein [Yoonia]|nr:DUF1127 domain-containing protein [Yoonia vestfoldensis]
MASFSHAGICMDTKRRPPLWSRIMQAAQLARQRRALAALDAHILCDIGITADDAQAEAGKPVWDVPRHWLA